MNHSETSLATRLLRGAKDMIWQEDPVAHRPVQAKAPSATSAAAPNAAQPSTVAVAPASNPLSAELMSLVLNRPTAFSALMDATKALNSIVLDEATRYRSAFALLKQTQQRSVAQVTQAVQIHLDLLQAEMQRFAGQSNDAQAQEITKRMQDAQALQKESEQCQQQIEQVRREMENRIAQLAQTMAEKQAKAQTLIAETEHKKRAIEDRKQAFEQAAHSVQQELQQQKQKIEQYLVD